MKEQTRTRAKALNVPNAFQVARELYGPAFEPRNRTGVGEAMADWGELSEAERSFTLGHLLYLNLQAQGSVTKALREIREVLEDTDEAVQAMADELVSEEEEEPEPGGMEEEGGFNGDDVDGGTDAPESAPPSDPEAGSTTPPVEAEPSSSEAVDAVENNDVHEGNAHED